MATITVSPADLAAAFKAARPGDLLSVTPGVIQRFRPGSPTWDASSNPVTIAPADPANPPLFVGGKDGAGTYRPALTMDVWPGVILRGLHFDIRDGGYGHQPAVSAAGGISINIAFEKCRIVGISDPTVDATGAPELGGIGYGISGKFKGLKVTECDFSDLTKGLVISDSEDVEIVGNDMFRITTDNVQLMGSKRVVIRLNQLRKRGLPLESTAHPDAIQIQNSVLGTPCIDVLIEDNLIVCDPSLKMSQGIFGSDNPQHDLIMVRRNVILGAIYRALSFQGQQVSFVDNYVTTSRPEGAGLYWNGQTGEVRGNTANKIATPLPTGASDNITVPLATPDQIAELDKAWMAKFRPTAAPAPYDPPVIIPPPPIPAPPPTVDYLAEANARIDRLLAERTKALELATLARKARAKNQYIDQLVALLSAPAP